MSLSFKLLVLVLAAAALLVAGFAFGHRVAEGEHAIAERESQRLAEATRQRLTTANDRLSRDLAVARAAQAPKDRLILKEVARYDTTVPADRRCALDGAWRVLHDAAATGEPADTGRLAPGAAAPVADAAALDTVAENYTDCRDWRGQLLGWQRWWHDVGAQLGASTP